MICQSWKVMFQAEYSSGQPLRMLVDLRASVEYALGKGNAEPEAKGKPAAATKPAANIAPSKAALAGNARAAAASKPAVHAPATAKPEPEPKAKAAAAGAEEAPEFEVSSTPGWDADPEPHPGKKN
jgi:hypothetical protein